VLVLTDEPNSPSVVEVRNNTVHTYQVGGIVGNFGGTELTVHRNSLVGLGPVPPATRIFQNGIQLAFGARGVVSSNVVADNSDPSGNRSSSAILVFGATVSENRAGNSDTGVASSTPRSPAETGSSATGGGSSTGSTCAARGAGCRRTRSTGARSRA
jgi:hypothetical protein